jgi:hypothetical protein
MVLVVPVWISALGALWAGASRSSSDTGTLYVNLGVLGISIASVLMLQHRRIAALERRLESSGSQLTQ